LTKDLLKLLTLQASWIQL